MNDDSSTCGCGDFHASRRTLLKGLTAMAGAGVMSTVTGGAFRQVAFAADGTASNVLVLLSLRGGADGLSMVVPYGDLGYAAARPKLAIQPGQLLATDGFFGLHPGFSPLLPLWNTGKMAAVQAIGLPQPNRSHFSAMEELEDADPGSPARQGWINRLLGLDVDNPSPVEGMNLGTPMVPTSLYGPHPTVSADRLDRMRLAGPQAELPYAARKASLQTVWDQGTGPLARGARAALDVVDVLSPLTTNATVPENGAVYPSGDLGRSLAETARVIRANVGAEVITVDYGSWDMHQTLGNAEWGNMRTMVEELAQAIAAFYTDLGPQADRVTVVTLSEFGRRVTENGSNGTDHGYGNVMLVMGDGVRGGYHTRGWPGLNGAALVDGDLAVTCDYRSVLTEVLRKTFNADTSQVFPGFLPETIGVMAA